MKPVAVGEGRSHPLGTGELRNRLLESLFRDMLEAVVIADGTRHIVTVNPAAEKLFEWEAGQLIGQSTQLLYADIETYRAEGDARFNPHADRPHETYVTRYKTRSGRVFEGETTGGAINDPESGRRLFIAVIRDVSDRLARDRAMRQLHAIASNAGLDFDARCHDMLRIGCELFELPIGVLSRIEGMRYEVVDVIHPADDIPVGSVFDLRDTYCANTLTIGGPVAYHHVGKSEIRNQSCYAYFGLESYIGSPVWVDSKLYGTLCFSSLEPRRAFPEEQLQFAALIAQWLGHEIARHADMVKLWEARDQLRQTASTDELTGLANRRRLSEVLTAERERALRYGTVFAVMLVDFDHFKRLNDRYGHAAGDRALKLFARTAGDVLRSVDTLGRWGGEEFLIVLPNTDAKGGRLLGRRIVEAVRSAPLEIDGARLDLTVSLGVATFDGRESIEALTARADTALYAAKAEGRDRLVSA